MKLTKKSVVIEELPSGQYRVLTPEERQDAIEKYERRIKLEEARSLIKKELNEKEIENYERKGKLVEARSLIKKELNEIAKTCKHPACVDEPGYTYHQRICLICGNISLV